MSVCNPSVLIECNLSSLTYLFDMQCVIINICMVRVAMSNIVPGSIMTAEWWSCQRNQVSLPEEFVEECFARLQSRT